MTDDRRQITDGRDQMTERDEFDIHFSVRLNPIDLNNSEFSR